MSHKACADFAMKQSSKGNDNSSPFLIIGLKETNSFKETSGFFEIM